MADIGTDKHQYLPKHTQSTCKDVLWHFCRNMINNENKKKRCFLFLLSCQFQLSSPFHRRELVRQRHHVYHRVHKWEKSHVHNTHRQNKAPQTQHNKQKEEKSTITFDETANTTKRERESRCWKGSKITGTQDEVAAVQYGLKETEALRVLTK